MWVISILSQLRHNGVAPLDREYAFNDVLMHDRYAELDSGSYGEKPPMVLFLMTLGAAFGLFAGFASIVTLGASLWTGFCTYIFFSLLGVAVGVLFSLKNDRGTPNAPDNAPRAMPQEFA